MKSVSKISILAILVTLCVFAPKASAAIVVDGLLNDWGVNPGAYNPSNPQAQWTPTPNSGINYVSEDQITYYLAPGYGGQDFDVEALYFKKEGPTAYFAIVSGFPITGSRLYGGQNYYAGDIGFDFNGDGSYEFGIDTRGHLGPQGELYGNATWTAPNYFPVSGPYALATGNALDIVNFSYNPNTYSVGGHYVFEFGVNTSDFGSYWNTDGNPDFTLHWTMSCGNDALDLHVLPTPEPSTYLLFLLGLSGLFKSNAGNFLKKFFRS